MRIIPAIDVIDGKCVRLSQGNYETKKIYNSSPLEIAKAYEANGIKHIHLVDLDGAKADTIVNWKVLHQIATKTNLKIDFGGGIKSTAAVKIAFENGANQITGGSVAVKSPELFEHWLKTYGAEKIILGADARGERMAVNGWKETTSVELAPFVNDYVQKGIKYVICTDISKDGMLQGTATELYKKMLAANPKLNLIASGGVAGIEDLDQLHRIGVEGVIIGKAIYENKITLKELALYVD